MSHLPDGPSAFVTLHLVTPRIGDYLGHWLPSFIKLTASGVCGPRALTILNFAPANTHNYLVYPVSQTIDLANHLYRLEIRILCGCASIRFLLERRNASKTRVPPPHPELYPYSYRLAPSISGPYLYSLRKALTVQRTSRNNLTVLVTVRPVGYIP